MANETTTKRTRPRAAGVREIARLAGYSPTHVSRTRSGERKGRGLRAKMRELGLKFQPLPKATADRHAEA